MFPPKHFSPSTLTFLSGLFSTAQLPNLNVLRIAFSSYRVEDFDGFTSGTADGWKALDAALCLPRYEALECIHFRLYVTGSRTQEFHPVREDRVKGLLPALSKRSNAVFVPLPFST